ncbi:MAG TPA: Fic family protein [Burkholderiales bacterium]|nr:Fic family protein [Burkholderiales bacterium]
MQSFLSFERILSFSLKALAGRERNFKSSKLSLNRQDFTAPEAGRLVTGAGGYLAFLPAPLPPKLNYSPELVTLISKADAALSELSGLGRLLPNPHLLIAPWMAREAVLSSRIEGTRASLSDVLIDEVGGVGPKPPEDLGEVRNYIVALEHGIERLPKLPLSLRLVREIHAKLMKGVRGDRATPGEFRRSQNWIGAAGSTPASAAYVPPPVENLLECLDDWEKFLHQRDAMPDLVQCALMHEQFEAIHPFLDGNGRVGRLLITLFLIERGRLSHPLLYLSDYIDEHRRDYYDLLQRVRTRGDWDSWLRYFINGVQVTAADAVKRTSHVIELREKFRSRVADKPKALSLVDQLFTNPYLTVARAEAVLKISNPTARKVVDLLIERKLIAQMGKRRWAKLYLAREVLEAIEGTKSK